MNILEEIKSIQNDMNQIMLRLYNLTNFTDDEEISILEYNTLRSLSSENIKIKNNILIGRFILSKSYLPLLLEMLDRKKKLGVIYGEFNNPDITDVSLTRVSHTIEHIDIKEFDDELMVFFECRILNTHWGREVKNFIEEDIVSALKMSLRYSTKENSIVKIFTVDILENN